MSHQAVPLNFYVESKGPILDAYHHLLATRLENRAFDRPTLARDSTRCLCNWVEPRHRFWVLLGMEERRIRRQRLNAFTLCSSYMQLYFRGPGAGTGFTPVKSSRFSDLRRATNLSSAALVLWENACDLMAHGYPMPGVIAAHRLDAPIQDALFVMMDDTYNLTTDSGQWHIRRKQIRLRR